MITSKLAIKFVVFCRNLTLVAKYALLQAPGHPEIWLQALGGILQPGWKGEKWKRLCESQTLVCWHPLQYYVWSQISLITSNVPQLQYWTWYSCDIKSCTLTHYTVWRENKIFNVVGRNAVFHTLMISVALSINNTQFPVVVNDTLIF